MQLSSRILSDITVYMKYARFLHDRKRRETWDELVTRNMNMHIKKFPHLEAEIRSNFEFVFKKKVLPSMRALQFGGKPVEISPNRQYNCAFTAVDHWEVFSEIMFLLLGGSGVGYSVQKHHVEQLPEIKVHLKRNRRFLIGDSIEGWAESVNTLLKSYFFGLSKPVFDFSDIREKGSPLVTSGGKAPGPQPLKDCLHNLAKILDAKEPGEKLTPLECHDMICYIADGVLAGGIRRAALLSLFSMDDNEMMSCKYGNWWETNPQRGRANNSVVILRHRITKKKFMGLWERIKATGNGDPGIYFTNDKEWGCNPCVTHDTWVQTDQGPKQVIDLIKEPHQTMVNGKPFNATGFWQTGNKPVFRLKTSRGYSIEATANHQICIPGDKWIPLEDLQPGDSICISNHRSSNLWDGPETLEDGWLLGEMIGDGGYNPSRYRSYLRFWGPSRVHMLSLAAERITRARSDCGSAAADKDPVTISATYLTQLGSRYIQAGVKDLLPTAEKTSAKFCIGLVRGMFDADGSVQGNQIKGVSIRLSNTNLHNLYTIQRILLRLGIASTIYENRCPEEDRLLPDGQGAHQYYHCQPCHELVIANDNLQRYKQLVNFDEPAKREKLHQLLSQYKRTPNRESFTTEVTSIELIGVKPVYDTSVKDKHEFCGNGLRVHNCGEIALRKNQFCNLATINVSDIEDQADLNARASAAAFIGTLQASYTDFHYLRQCWQTATEKEALLGVSMTGIASSNIFECDLPEAAEIVLEENSRVAKLIGVSSAARATCVKPEGTSSCVLGSSSGIHGWHSPYYIRRIRVLKTEAIYKYLKKRIPGLVEDDYFKTETQAIISIPIKAPESAVFRNEPSLDLLERIKRFNIEWVKPGHVSGENTHNVSATISVKEDEWDVVGKWMWENRKHYNGLTVLPYDASAYKQPPFEEIDEETYEDMFKLLKEINLEKVLEEEDNTTLKEQVACAGGVCEIS